MGLYETLKAAKIGAASDVFTTLRGRQVPFAKGGYTEKELTDTPPLSFTANGDNLVSWAVYGSLSQSGTPAPDNPVMPSECGNLSSGDYIIPISCGGVTTNVKLSEKQSERQIKKYEFTGNETFSEYDTTYNRFGFALSDSLVTGVRRSPIVCTHFQGIYDGRTLANVPDNSVYSGSNYSQWYIKTTDYTDTTTFKAYLQQQYSNGTPVTIWYVLATPTTGTVNEPLRKISTYTDSVSDVASIPTVNGSNTLSVGTTVQPSSVYIKYKE